MGSVAVVYIFISKRINIKEPSNFRLMISPLEGVPIQSEIIHMLLALEFPSIFN